MGNPNWEFLAVNLMLQMSRPGFVGLQRNNWSNSGKEKTTEKKLKIKTWALGKKSMNKVKHGRVRIITIAWAQCSVENIFYYCAQLETIIK